jgi:hypothetical protein
MAMEVHDASEHDMDRFIRECACLFHNRRSRGHLSLSFWIQFFKYRVNIVLQCGLIFVIKKNIALASDVCSKPSITIRSHDLRVGDIRGTLGEIISYQEIDKFSPFFWLMQVVLLWAFPWPSLFFLPCDGSDHRSFILFFSWYYHIIKTTWLCKFTLKNSPWKSIFFLTWVIG